MREVKVNDIYKHFKGHTYKVIAIGYDSENYNENDPLKSRLVVYKNIENDEVWVWHIHTPMHFSFARDRKMQFVIFSNWHWEFIQVHCIHVYLGCKKEFEER